MSLDLEPTTGKPTPPRRSRARWMVIAVAAAVVVIAAISSLVLWLGENDKGHTDGGLRPDSGASAPATTAPAPSASASGEPSASPGRTGDVTRLTLAPQPARCLPPSVDRLRSAALAFKATVGQIGRKFVVLKAQSWIHADGFGGTDTVRVALPGPRTDLPVTFQPGKTYLIAATGDAQVVSCGLSGVKTPSLTKLYADAF